MKSFKEYLKEEVVMSVKNLNKLIAEFNKKYKNNLKKVKNDPNFKKLSKDAQLFIADELEI